MSGRSADGLYNSQSRNNPSRQRSNGETPASINRYVSHNFPLCLWDCTMPLRLYKNVAILINACPILGSVTPDLKLCLDYAAVVDIEVLKKAFPWCNPTSPQEFYCCVVPDFRIPTWSHNSWILASCISACYPLHLMWLCCWWVILTELLCIQWL